MIDDNPQGFGIIKASDGSKLAFILSDFARHQSRTILY
jgi:hypothetical protein